MALVLSVALIVMFTIPANAVSIKEADVEKEFVCTVENEKITDENILLDRALKGINDAPKEIVKSIEENVELSVNGVVQYEKPLITTELLKSYSNLKSVKAKISHMGNTYKAKSTQVRCGYKGIKYGGGK